MQIESGYRLFSPKAKMQIESGYRPFSPKAKMQIESGYRPFSPKAKMQIESGERWERRRWRGKRPERVAAVGVQRSRFVGKVYTGYRNKERA